MNVIGAVLLVGIIILLLVGVFLWEKRRDTTEEQPAYDQEIAEELTVPTVPDIQQKEKEDLELPHNYGVDRMFLLVRDPHWLYAYWEISATKENEIKTNIDPNAWKSSTPVLRVYEQEENGETGHIDFDLSGDQDDWHINTNKPNSTFYAELGRKLPDGNFIPILQSNTVSTPRDNISDRLDEEWMWIEDIYKSLTKIPFEGSSPSMTEQKGKAILPLGIGSPGVSSPGQRESWR